MSEKQNASQNHRWKVTYDQGGRNPMPGLEIDIVRSEDLTDAQVAAIVEERRLDAKVKRVEKQNADEVVRCPDGHGPMNLEKKDQAGYHYVCPTCKTRVLENADAPMRGKCEWCNDPDAPKRKRTDGSIVYQCWKCAEKIPLSNAGNFAATPAEPVSMESKENAGAAAYGSKENAKFDKTGAEIRPMGYEMGADDNVVRKTVDTSRKGDHGSDPLGGGKFRMVPSGDIVDAVERDRRLKERGNSICPDCDAWKKKGGAGMCEKCTRAAIDQDPKLKVLQEKGRGVLSDIEKGLPRYMKNTGSADLDKHIAGCARCQKAMKTETLGREDFCPVFDKLFSEIGNAAERDRRLKGLGNDLPKDAEGRTIEDLKTEFPHGSKVRIDDTMDGTVVDHTSQKLSSSKAMHMVRVKDSKGQTSEWAPERLRVLQAANAEPLDTSLAAQPPEPVSPEERQNYGTSRYGSGA